MVKKRFLKTEISNALDSTEDDELKQESGKEVDEQISVSGTQTKG